MFRGGTSAGIRDVSPYLIRRKLSGTKSRHEENTFTSVGVRKNNTRTHRMEGMTNTQRNFVSGGDRKGSDGSRPETISVQGVRRGYLLASLKGAVDINKMNPGLDVLINVRHVNLSIITVC